MTDDRYEVHYSEDCPPGKAYLINPEHMLTIPGEEIDWAPRDEDTYLLALQSIDRWGRRYRVSPAMRLRAIRAVVDAALAQSDV